MGQKSVFIFLWGAVVVGWLFGGGTFGGAQVKREGEGATGEQPPSKVVERIGPEEAKTIAAAFVGEERAKEIRYLGRYLRKTFPPFVMCHRFKIPLGVKLPAQEVQIPDETAPKGYRVETRHEEPLEAAIWVEEETGRVVTYETDFGYQKAKYQDKERPKESELMSPERAIEIAKEVVSRARVPMEGMRLRAVPRKPQPDKPDWIYRITWDKLCPGSTDRRSPVPQQHHGLDRCAYRGSELLFIAGVSSRYSIGCSQSFQRARYRTGVQSLSSARDLSRRSAPESG